MKNLLYIFSFIFLFACVDKRNMITLKKGVGKDLYLINRQVTETIQRYLQQEVQDFKKIASRRQPKKFFKLFRYAQKLEKSYKNCLEKINQSNTNLQCHIIYTEYHHSLVKDLQNNSRIWKDVKPYLYEPNNLSYLLLMKQKQTFKEIVKAQLFQNFIRVLDRLFRRDLSGCVWLTKIELVGNNQFQKIKEGELLTLQQFIINSDMKKKYDYTFHINRGGMKQEKQIWRVSYFHSHTKTRNPRF